MILKRRTYDVVVIGGGFFGCRLAVHLGSQFKHVLLVEKKSELVQSASYANQARVHQGYHYPHSLLTGQRSRVNFDRFVSEYPECIDDEFDKYYAIASAFSDVTATQFQSFCQHIGAPLAPASASVKKLFNFDLIEDVFLVKEFAFDAVKLRRRLKQQLANSNVEVCLGTEVTRVRVDENIGANVSLHIDGSDEHVFARKVFNCTYASVNNVLSIANLPNLALKYQLAEIALVEPPEFLTNLGITVMCGPFFSTMPFPSRGLHSLSHVRYTPHVSWHDHLDENKRWNGAIPSSNFPMMIRDAARFLPGLEDCKYVDSLWEVKALLPASEVDASRPILIAEYPGQLPMTSILGAKIDNIYDALDEVSDSEGIAKS